ncbi:MAG: hypothetical protein J6T26_04860 [Firmicutes bacterium]|nr:hypothetical protein [Bacillota bacterium]
MNPLFSFLGGGKSGGMDFISLIVKAVKAAKSGQTPEAFLKDVAKTRPELQGLDLDDLEATANQLAKKKGKDINALKSQAADLVQKYS